MTPCSSPRTHTHLYTGLLVHSVDVPCTHTYASWAVEGMVVTGKFRRAPDMACSFSHDRQQSLAICVHRVVDHSATLCSKLRAVVLTGDFDLAVERELPAGDPNGQRRLSSIEAAFNHANISWPTLGVLPLWGPGAEPHGNKWPDCCGFVELSDPQCQWSITRHGSIDVVLANIGLGPQDQKWHQEKWWHSKFTGRKRRGVASPAGFMSQQKVVPHHQS